MGDTALVVRFNTKTKPEDSWAVLNARVEDAIAHIDKLHPEHPIEVPIPLIRDGKVYEVTVKRL